MQRLVHGLLDADFRVTLIARTWDFPPLPNLRWIRVRGPRRPFTLAYPWFFVLGSFLAWWHRRGLLHINGAIVVNRADVITVMYCHAAARDHDGRTARRTSRLYRLNSSIGARLSVIGERLVYRPKRQKAIVGLSSGVVEEIRRSYPRLRSRTRLIPSAVDHTVFRPDAQVRSSTRQQLGLAATATVAIFVGGDWDRKGLRFAIEAVAKVPDVDLIVVGPGDRERFERLAIDCGAGNRVHFVGPTEHPDVYFKAADVLLLPTAYETFSLATYEAAACQLALLVTAVSGVTDILEDGVCGWFISRNSDVIATHLKQLRDDSELRTRMGIAARQATKPFTWERVVRAYIDLYEELAQEDQPRLARVQRPLAATQNDQSDGSSLR